MDRIYKDYIGNKFSAKNSIMAETKEGEKHLLVTSNIFYGNDERCLLVIIKEMHTDIRYSIW